MTPAEQAKVLDLLDSIDPFKIGPQTMREKALEAKQLLLDGGFDPQAGMAGPGVLEDIKDELVSLKALLVDFGAVLEEGLKKTPADEGTPKRARASV